jgi:hypothetical protein
LIGRGSTKYTNGLAAHAPVNRVPVSVRADSRPGRRCVVARCFRDVVHVAQVDGDRAPIPKLYTVSGHIVRRLWSDVVVPGDTANVAIYLDQYLSEILLT